MISRAIVAFALVSFASTGFAEPAALIPRAVLFGNSERTLPRMSPDGKSLSWIAPDEQGVLNVWTSAFDGSGRKLLTNERRPIFTYQWSADGTHILFEQDGDGDELTHLFAVELATGNVRDLTPFRGVRAQNLMVSATHPKQLLVALNLRDRTLFDMHRIDLTTGAVTVEAKNPGDVLTWNADSNFVIRAHTAYDDEGRTIVRVRDHASAPWRDLVTFPFERAPFIGQVAGGSVIAGFTPDGKSLDVVSTLHSDTSRLERIDVASGKTVGVIAEHPQSDVDEEWPLSKPAVIRNPRSGALEAVRFQYTEREWRFVDDAIRGDLQRIERETGASIDIIDRDLTDRRWLVTAYFPGRPESYYTYDRASKKVTLLFHGNPALVQYTLAKPKPVIIPARDGLQMVSYLTIPPGSDGRKLPLALVPHGGPWDRDGMFFVPQVQFLANRGFAVLQVNYRGSTGFGTKYLNAGDHEFGRGMNEDLYDGVRWAIAQGIADPKRIVVIGGSAGGYATLRAMTTHPEMFACAVDIVGPSDVKTLLASFPRYWAAAKKRWVRRIGDAENDPALNRRISPLYDAAKITKPLLIAQGGNDPRVTIENSNLMVKAMRDAGREVTYVVYPDEGHNFMRAENNLDFYGRIDEFFHRCAGTRYEPYTKIEGTSAELR